MSILDIFGGAGESGALNVAPQSASTPTNTSNGVDLSSAESLFSFGGLGDFFGGIRELSTDLLNTAVNVKDDYLSGKLAYEQLMNGSYFDSQEITNATPEFESWAVPESNDKSKYLVYGAIGVAGLAVAGWALK